MNSHVRHGSNVPAANVLVEGSGTRQTCSAMLVTAATFQPPMSWLKAVAPANMLSMLVTAATFQQEMSSLKVAVIAKQFTHVRHLRDVPAVDGTEIRILQCSFQLSLGGDRRRIKCTRRAGRRTRSMHRRREARKEKKNRGGSRLGGCLGRSLGRLGRGLFATCFRRFSHGYLWEQTFEWMDRTSYKQELDLFVFVI